MLLQSSDYDDENMCSMAAMSKSERWKHMQLCFSSLPHLMSSNRSQEKKVTAISPIHTGQGPAEATL